MFVNHTRLAKDVDVYSLNSGDTIGLGVDVKQNEAVPPRFGIFILKENLVNMKDIVVISDDEDTDENEPVGKEVSNIDGVKPIPVDKPLSPNADERSSGTIHLPILPDVKKEILSQASKEIENIFGEPDEELLESVLNINPYIYKTLNNNNLNTAGKKLCDGDHIEVPEETNKSNIEPPRSKQTNSPIVEKIIFEVEDYDENFAMSQAVLQEMKEEMADESADLSYSENEQQNEDEQIAEEENEYLELSNFKTEIATQMNEDEIILIEDDDDELFSKFTDWSSKLLSQNVMSQVYPLEDEALSTGENQYLQVVENSKSKTNEDDIPNRPFLNGERSSTPNFDASEYTTSLPGRIRVAIRNDVILKTFLTVDTISPIGHNIRRCSVRLKSICDPQSMPSLKANNQEKTKSHEILELESDDQSKTNTSLHRHRSDVDKSANNKDPLETEPSPPKPDAPIIQSNYKNSDKIAEWLKSDNLDIQYNESNSESSDTISTSRKRTKSIEGRSDSDANDKLGKTPSSSPVPEEKPRSSRLLNRSKSLYLDSSLTSPTNVNETVLSPTSSKSKAKTNDENRRKPTVIPAPLLPKCRGKLRGVSAANNKESVLKRQRLVDNDMVMKAKWYQKPKDKKKDCEGIKEKRREQLKKLAEKSKSSAPADASSSERKRKALKVPTLGNSNRGEFLTVEGELPTTKRLKLDKTKRPLEKPIPKRRATIECFSQKTVDVNETDAPSASSKLLVRPIKRKEAEIARNQRTCNRVTFADMESDFELRQLRDKQAKKNRHVRFNDTPQIKLIQSVEGANKKVRIDKDTKKMTLSTYAERRTWAMSMGKLENYNDIITGDILRWGNQWLKSKNADEVAESDVLMPIPTEFSSYKQYKE